MIDFGFIKDKPQEPNWDELQERASENIPEWYNKPFIGYLIAFIVLLFTVYQHFDNRYLNREVDLLNKKSDSLNNLILTYKDSVYELKQQLEKQKPQLKQDTLSTFYHSDLNN